MLFLVIVDASTVLVPLACNIWMIGGVWARDALDGIVGRPSWTFLLAPLVYLGHGIMTVKAPHEYALTFGHGIMTVKAPHEYALTWNGDWYQVTKTRG